MKNVNWLNHFLNFIAVILGVFLAFYISARSEAAKDQVELNEILSSLIEELNDDIRTFNSYQIPKNEMQVEAIGILVENIINSEADSIDSQLSISLEVQNYSPASPTYHSITSTGKINLINDLDTRKALSMYYDEMGQESLKKGELQVEFFLNQILPWMIENTNMLDVQLDEMAGNIQFANRLILYSTLIDNKVEDYRIIHETAEDLKQKLMDLRDKNS